MTREPYQVAGNIRHALRTITDNYDDALEAATPRDDNDTKTVRADPPPPVSAHIIDLRAETKRDLAYYCLFVLNEVNGGSITTHVDATSILDMATFLDRWALALAEQHPDDADVARRDLERHGHQLRDLVAGDHKTKFQLKDYRCPEMVWRDDHLVRCDGTLSTVLWRGSGMLPASIGCDYGHAWAPREWLTLGRKLISA